MRTLETKKEKIKPQEVNKKKMSKKITKTVFYDPFHYRIQTLSYQDSKYLQDCFLQYFSQIRKKGQFKLKIIKQKFISFEKKQTNIKNQPPLRDESIIVGIRKNSQQINRNKLPCVIIIFYQPKKHSILEELFCQIIYKKIPYIIVSENIKLCQAYGVKNLSAIGIKDQQHQLYKTILSLCSKCLVQIPWLVQGNWIPLKTNQNQ